jgi:hypothetical protein
MGARHETKPPVVGLLRNAMGRMEEALEMVERELRGGAAR